MGALGTTELIIILAVIILLFGARKLPELASSIGKSIQEFRKAAKEGQDDDDETATTAGDDEA